MKHLGIEIILSLALLGTAACQNDGSTDVGVEASDLVASEEATDAPAARRGHPPVRGPLAWSHIALDELELSAAQRAAIEDAMPAPYGHMAAPRALATAIRDNTVDAAMRRPDRTEARARLVVALDVLHDTLTADQRQTLVATLTERRAEHEKHPPPSAGRPPHAPTDMLLHGVDVSDAQRSRIEAALVAAGIAMERPSPTDMAAVHETLQGLEDNLLSAFSRDDFDADASLVEPPRRQGGPSDFIEAIAVVVPLLDDAQREALASRLERGPRMAGRDSQHPQRLVQRPGATD